MTDNVVNFEPSVVGEGYRFDPDETLEAAKGKEFTKVAILAEKPDGSMWISGNADAGETMVLMEKAKRKIVFGED